MALSKEYIEFNHRLRAAFKDAPTSVLTWTVEKSMLRKLLADFVRTREPAYQQLETSGSVATGKLNLLATVHSNFRIVTSAVAQYLETEKGIELDRFATVKQAIDSHLVIEEQIVFPVLQSVMGGAHV
jgi:hypothetical protein